MAGRSRGKSSVVPVRAPPRQRKVILETMKKRLKALEAKVVEARPDPDRGAGHSLGESQDRKGGSQAKFESEYPGYCGAQDTFYVGNFIRIQTSVSPSHTQGWSRVRESRPQGSGRGAVSNDRPLYVANVWHDHFCRMREKR
jgi:hypothetical protein